MRRRARSSDYVAGIDLSLTGAAAVIIDVEAFATMDWGAIVDAGRFGSSLVRDADPLARVERLRMITDAVTRMLRRWNVADAFVEDYSFGLAQGAHQLGEIGGAVKLAAFADGIVLRPVNHSTARKLLLGVGSGKGIKEATHAALRGAGVPDRLRSGDELDAFVIANYGLSELGHPALTLARPDLPPRNVPRTSRRRKRG